MHTLEAIAQFPLSAISSRMHSLQIILQSRAILKGRNVASRAFKHLCCEFKGTERHYRLEQKKVESKTEQDVKESDTIRIFDPQRNKITNQRRQHEQSDTEGPTFQDYNVPRYV